MLLNGQPLEGGQVTSQIQRMDRVPTGIRVQCYGGAVLTISPGTFVTIRDNVVILSDLDQAVTDILATETEPGGADIVTGDTSVQIRR